MLPPLPRRHYYAIQRCRRHAVTVMLYAIAADIFAVIARYCHYADMYCVFSCYAIC